MHLFIGTGLKKFYDLYNQLLCWVVVGFAFVAGAGIFAMIGTTCADIVLRRFGHPIIGAYDVVRIAGAITLASALPYTTAVKGHVAIEYFIQKLGQRTQIVIDSILRLLSMSLFGFLGWRTVLYGAELYRAGRVSDTLQVPLFWVPYVMGVCCFVVVLVIAYNLFHPGREMIKP